MDDVAKAVFLADKLDPQKVEAYPYLVKVETLASLDMDDAILEYVDREIEHLLNNGLLVHPATIDLRNELLMRPTRSTSPGTSETAEQ
jgi:HD superfamily phosphohydrolase YqeK